MSPARRIDDNPPKVPVSALHLGITMPVWRYAEPFVIARGTITTCDALQLTLTDDTGRTGRSESYGIPYAGETPQVLQAQIAALAGAADGRLRVDRQTLLRQLPAGGARCALDLALWDLEARQGLGDPFSRNGLAPHPVTTAYTIGIRDLAGYEAQGRLHARCAWLKVKVDDRDPVAAVEAVRRGAPACGLIVDPNQSWTPQQLREVAPAMARLGVGLLEQPSAVGTEDTLDGYDCPVPLCADESLDDIDDLPAIAGRFQAINIKLDKAGGLTAALRLADAAQRLGLALMVGCMGGTSLAMAPGMVLAQRCRWVDLDGPRLLDHDMQPGFDFVDGVVPRPHLPALWG